MANLSHLPEQWRQSGLSQRAFCEREGLRLATFSYWRRKELQAPNPSSTPSAPPPAAKAFTEVRVEPDRRPAADAPAIEIHFPDGTRVSIPYPTAAAAAAPRPR